MNFRGIAESVRLNVALTSIELIGLGLVVLIGIAALTSGGPSIDLGRAVEFDGDGGAIAAVLAGAGLAFFALIGFEDSVNLAEEARDPSRGYPRALFAGLLIAGAIYILVTVIASSVVPTDRLASSDGPLLEVSGSGPLAMPDKVFSAIALFALANGALINMIMASRIVYGMARERILPPVLGAVHAERRTPWVAIVITTAIAMVLVASGDLSELADTTVLLLLFVFTAVNIAALVLRRSPVDHEHFRAPAIFPAAGAAVSCALMTTKDGEIFIRAGILLVAGVLLWIANWALYARHHPPREEG